MEVFESKDKNYWEDSYKNKWLKSEFSRAEAVNSAKSLSNCKNTINCYNCTYVSDSVGCNNCHYVTQSLNSRFCYFSKKLKFCTNVIHGENLLFCKGVSNCRDKEKVDRQLHKMRLTGTKSPKWTLQRKIKEKPIKIDALKYEEKEAYEIYLKESVNK